MCFAAITGGVIYILPKIGLSPPGSNILWSRYLVTTQTIWRVPIEFYIATVAVVLLVSRRSVHWSILLGTALFATNLGMINRNPRNVLLWIMILTSLIALHASNSAFTGTLKTFGYNLINDVINIQQRSTAAWKFISVILAGTLFIYYIHNETIKYTSEAARGECLIKQYKNAKEKLSESDGIRLEIFSDYQCAACSQLTPKYLKMANTAGVEAILMKLRDYPLDSSCNDYNSSSGLLLPHQSACSAAYAAKLAERETPDKVDGFRTWLYANQTILDDDVIM